VRITEQVGDFIAGDEVLIIHGCNAQGEMGAGAALAIRQRIPIAYHIYRSLYLLRGLTLGEVIFAIDVGQQARQEDLGPGIVRPRIVGNAITQKFYGSAGRYVSYEAIQNAIREVDRFVARTHDDIQIAGVTPITKVGMPMIGAGLGGGLWHEIAKIIEAESHHFQPVVYRLGE
jgi:O-acetyl-ADP-ribose deacetylase (regulator of RNase III)